MLQATEIKKYSNSLGYPEISTVEGFTPMGSAVLLQWEEGHDEIKYKKLHLIRPEPQKGRHYTGVVLSVGPDVKSDEIQVGYRVLFEQFCGFKQFFHKDWGRLALVDENHILCLVPARENVESGEPDFDYSR